MRPAVGLSRVTSSLRATGSHSRSISARSDISIGVLPSGAGITGPISAGASIAPRRPPAGAHPEKRRALVGMGPSAARFYFASQFWNRAVTS